MFMRRAAAQARFNSEKMGKANIAQGDHLFTGLNCFEPGQEHAPHVHEGQDKFYVIFEGQGIVTIGDQTEELTAGDAAFVPSGVLHSIRNPGPDRLIVMAILAPPPRN